MDSSGEKKFSLMGKGVSKQGGLSRGGDSRQVLLLVLDIDWAKFIVRSVQFRL